MAVDLSSSQALGDHFYHLTKALWEGEQVKIDACYKKLTTFIDTHFVHSKSVSDNELKAEINLIRFEKATPLYAAITERNLEIAEYLLKLGADPNRRHAEDGWQSVHDAASVGSADMIKLLIAHKGDVAAITNNGETPLHIAALSGKTRAMKYLIACGAKIDQLDNDGLSAGFHIRSYGFPKTEKRFPLDVITAEIVARKFLAHVHGIEGETFIVANKTMKLTSFHTYIVCQSLLPYLAEFDGLHKVDRNCYDEVLRAFHFCAYAKSPEEYLQRIQSGELTFIPTGWDEHAVIVAFKGDMAAILNKGEGVTADRQSIHAFSIDKTRLTINDIKDILAADTDMNSSEGQEFFYQTLPQRLSPSQDTNTQKLCDALRTFYLPKLTYKGTCTYGAIKAAIQFGFSVLALLKSPDLPYEALLAQIKAFSSRFSTFCRLKSVKEYLVKHFKDDEAIAEGLAKSDSSLIQQAWRKLNSWLAKKQHPLSDAEREDAKQINATMKKIKAAMLSPSATASLPI